MSNCDWLQKTCLNGINAESAAESWKGAEESIQEVRAQELLPRWKSPKSHCFLAKKLHILLMLDIVDNIFHSGVDCRSGVVWKRNLLKCASFVLPFLKNFTVCMIDRCAVQSLPHLHSRARINRWGCYFFKFCTFYKTIIKLRFKIL